MKSILTRLFAVFVVFVVSVTSQCWSQEYEVTKLNDGPFTFAWGLNDKGQISGATTFNSNNSHAFLYDNGTMQDLGAFLGSNFSGACGINNKGQVVGFSSYSTTDSPHAFLYDNGNMQDLTPFAEKSMAVDINDSGQAVGYSWSDSGWRNAFLYNNGSIQNIGSAENSRAYAINNKSQVVGMSDNAPFLWQASTGFHNLGTFGGQEGKAFDVNNYGQAVGYATTTDGKSRAFLYNPGGQMQDLNNLVSLPAGHTLISANAINDKGQIVGYANIDDRTSYTFLYNPGGKVQSLSGYMHTPSPMQGMNDFIPKSYAINNLGQIVGANPNAVLITPVGNCQSFQVKQPTCTPIERLAKWDGTNWVAVMPNDPSLSSKNIHVFINGWAPGLKTFSENGGQSWSNVDPKTGEVVDNDYATIFTSLAKNVKNLAPDNVVLTYSWIDRSATENPGTNPLLISKYSKESRNGTDEAGGDLLEALRNSCNFSANPNSKLQLFGISHGARVAAWTANELYKQDSIVVDQLTFCDSPEFGPEKIAGGQNNIEQILPSLKLGKDAESTLIDNYDSSILGKFYAGIGVVNVRLHSGSINPGVAHMYAANWYNEASMPLNVSVNNNALAWSPLLGDTYKTLGSSYEQNESSEFVLKDLTINQDLPVESRRSLPLSLLISEGSVSPITNGVCLTENSPAYWHTSFSKDANDTTLEFSYQFLNPGDGDQLGIWIDDELRFIITGSLVGIGLQMSDIDITDLDSGYHILSVALHSYGDVGCSVNITDFTMISVPEPSTLVLLITVLITLFTATKLHK